MNTDNPFKIGDRVVVKRSVAGVSMPGATGTVVHIHHAYPEIGVQFDEIVPNHGGHDCAGNCKYGYGRYGSADEFEFLDEISDFSEECSTELISFISLFSKRGDIDGV